MRLRKEVELLKNDDINLVAQVSDALAHPVRIMLYQHILLCNAKLEKVCNKDLVSAFPYSQATISQHMNKLVRSGLVQLQNKERYSFYHANVGMFANYLKCAKSLSQLQARDNPLNL